MAHAARNPCVANMISHTTRLRPPRSQKSRKRVVSACLRAVAAAGPSLTFGTDGSVVADMDNSRLSDKLVSDTSVPASGSALQFRAPAGRARELNSRVRDDQG